MSLLIQKPAHWGMKMEDFCIIHSVILNEITAYVLYSFESAKHI